MITEGPSSSRCHHFRCCRRWEFWDFWDLWIPNRSKSMRISAFCDVGELRCNVCLYFLRDVSYETIGFGIRNTVLGRACQKCFENLRDRFRRPWKSQQTKKMLRDIQSLVSPTPGETLPQKVVSRLRETVVSIWGDMAGPEPDPASPEPHLGLDSIYSNSRSTAQSGRYVIDNWSVDNW